MACVETSVYNTKELSKADSTAMHGGIVAIGRKDIYLKYMKGKVEGSKERKR